VKTLSTSFNHELLVGVAWKWNLRPEGTQGSGFELWPVDDVTTAHLMTSFYTHLRSGKDMAEAPRTAQIELIQRNASHLYD